MWDECVPPRDFVVRGTDSKENRCRINAGLVKNIAKTDEFITEIPSVCNDVEEMYCGETPKTVGKCRWREKDATGSQKICNVVSKYPHWGKIECNKNTETASQWCRRVYPLTPALKTAAGPLKLGELHYSRWLILSRAVSAQQQKVLSRHYTMKDRKFTQNRKVGYMEESVWKLYQTSLKDVRLIFCPNTRYIQTNLFFKKSGVQETNECNLKIQTCRAFANKETDTEITDDFWTPSIADENDILKLKTLTGIKDLCSSAVQNEIKLGKLFLFLSGTMAQVGKLKLTLFLCYCSGSIVSKRNFP